MRVFTMPDFPCDGRSIDINHLNLLFVHGLLSEDVPGMTLEMAERELAKIMPSYTFGNTRVEVGPGKYKTASLVWGLYKLHRQRGGNDPIFWVVDEDIQTILSFMTDAIINDAKANPGKHPFVIYVLDCIAKNKPIELGVNLAEVA